VPGWLKRNSGALEASGGIAAAFAPLTALLVIPHQTAQADRIQRDQVAREIYREFLNLTVQKPDLANSDYCALADEGQKAAYAVYVEYLIHTAEQMIDTLPDWRAPMASYLGDHMAYLCPAAASQAQSPDIRNLDADLAMTCKPELECH
jgi:hypothetical protein